MLKKILLSTIVLAGFAAASATTASAAGYGYNNGGGYGGGYQQPAYEAPLPAHAWQQHVAWCYDRFKSYNAYDNTYQPYEGPRQQCWSPYYNG